MKIYKYKLAEGYVNNLVIFLDLLFYLVPKFAKINCTLGSFGGSQSDAVDSYK